MVKLCRLPYIIGQAYENLTEQEDVKWIYYHRKYVAENGVEKSHFCNEQEIDRDNGLRRNYHQQLHKVRDLSPASRQGKLSSDSQRPAIHSLSQWKEVPDLHCK